MKCSPTREVYHHSLPPSLPTSLPPSLTANPTSLPPSVPPAMPAEWWWRCVMCNHVVRGISLLLAFLSVMIIFAEATLLSHKWVDLSLISALILMAGLHENIVLVRGDARCRE